MNEKPLLVRSWFKIGVLIFAATLMAGYVAFSDHTSKARIRGTKSTSILEDLRLIDGAKDKCSIETNLNTTSGSDAKNYLKPDTRLGGAPAQAPNASPFQNDEASPNPLPTQSNPFSSGVELKLDAPLKLDGLYRALDDVISSTKSAPVFRPTLFPQPAQQSLTIGPPAPQKPRIIAPSSKSFILVQPPAQEPGT